MNEIKVVGKQKFMDKEIIQLEGGFGEGKRILTDKMVAEIHGIQNKHVRETINKNIKRFKESIDFIDLKQRVDNADPLDLTQFGYSKQAISQANNIYVLSERGYGKLIKIMDSDLAWDIYDKLLDEYFTMREVINSDEQLLANLCLQLYKGGQDAVIASQKITEIEVAKATQPLLEDISNKKEIIHKQENEITHKEDVIILKCA